MLKHHSSSSSGQKVSLLKVRFLLLTGALSASPALAQGISFDFLGFSVGTPAPTDSRLAGKKCKPAPTGVSRCSIFAGAVLGRARVLDLTVTFNDARLIGVSGAVVLSFYSDLVEAFEVKYGKPTRTEVLQWQNQVGNKFDNQVRIWDFDDGQLKLYQRGSSRDMPEFQFVANQNLPETQKRSPPPVNF